MTLMTLLSVQANPCVARVKRSGRNLKAASVA